MITPNRKLKCCLLGVITVISIFEIYEDELISFKIVASYHDWYKNLKIRVKQYFKIDLRSLIPK